MSQKTSSTKRSLARLFAVQALFEIEATRRAYGDVVEEILARESSILLDDTADETPKADVKMTREIVSDAVFHQVRIDQTVDKVLSENWPLRSVDPVLRAVFRAAGAEFIRARAPFKVVINEYLDVTRAFDDQKETIGFVNAVLDGVNKTLSE